MRFGTAVTPQASLQAPGSDGIGRSIQPSLAAALARASAEGRASPLWPDCQAETKHRASELNSTSRAGATDTSGSASRAAYQKGTRPTGQRQPSKAEAGRPDDERCGSQVEGLKPEAEASSLHINAAGARLTGRQDVATSSASFDSWNSRQRSGESMTCPASQNALTKAAQTGWLPTAAAAAAVTGKQGKGSRTEWLLAQVQQASLTPGSVHSTSHARPAFLTPAASPGKILPIRVLGYSQAHLQKCHGDGTSLHWCLQQFMCMSAQCC